MDKMFNRRGLLLAGISLVPILAGCTGATPAPGPVPGPTPAPSGLMDYVNIILQTMQKAVPAVQNFLSADTYAKVLAGLSAAAQFAGQIAAAIASGASPAAWISGFIGAITNILPLIGGFGVNVPTWLPSVISDIKFVLPLILAFAGVAARRGDIAPNPEALAAYGRLRAFVAS